MRKYAHGDGGTLYWPNIAGAADDGRPAFYRILPVITAGTENIMAMLRKPLWLQLLPDASDQYFTTT